MPKVPQGVSLSAAELVSWNTHIHNSELDLLGQLILTMKRQSATLDKEATKSLLEFNTQLNDHKVYSTNVEKAKSILSEKVGKERDVFKMKLKNQVDKLTENYKAIKSNLYFLKNSEAAQKNKPSKAASCLSSSTQRMKQPFVKKASQSNRSTQNVAKPTPRFNLPPKQVGTNTRPPPIPTTGMAQSSGPTNQTDTQTALLMKVVERLERQQEELNFLKDYSSLPRDRQRSRSLRQRS